MARKHFCFQCLSPVTAGYDRCRACSHRRWEPSPEEIRAVCRQIQSEWTDADERNRRRVPLDKEYKPIPYSIPQVRIVDQE